MYGMTRKTGIWSGFTLIEMLIVIAIIAILAALLFPAFEIARDKARQSSCSSNEKQIAVAMLQYVQDYDDIPPCGSDLGNGGYAGMGWVGQVYSYVESKNVFHCPNDLGLKSPQPTAGQIWPSYRYNQDMVRKNNTSDSSDPNYSTAQDLTLSAYTAPSRTVMICETTSDPINPANDTNGTPSPAGNGEWTGNMNYIIYPTGASMCPFVQMQPSLDISPMRRHENGSNIVCADGHLKWVTPEMVSFGFNNYKTSTTGPFNDGSLIAEGSQYSGVGCHEFTFSIN